MEEKESLEKRISFLEDSIKRREQASFIDTNEAKALKDALNDELIKSFLSDKARFENLLKDIDGIVDNGTKAMDEAQDNGVAINQLQKNGQYTFPLNVTIVGFYNNLKQFSNRYKLSIRPTLETLIPKE